MTRGVADKNPQVAKSMNYVEHPLGMPAFVLCIIVWTYMRHYLNLKVLWSIITEFSTVGPYELNWETEQYKCWISQAITFGLLAALQSLNLFWLYCLFRVSYRFVFLNIAKDDRSETEPDSELEETEVVAEKLEKLVKEDKMGKAAKTTARQAKAVGRVSGRT
jgi:very-long-chain ceramide synthase